MKIDKEATHAQVRAHYGSVNAFARACGVPGRIYYQAVAEGRGQVQKRSMPAKVLERLKAEGLLVVDRDN